MNIEESTVVEIADGVTVKLTFPKPKSRDEALERLRDCVGDSERSIPLLRMMDIAGIRIAFSEWLAEDEDCFEAIESKREDEVFYATHQ